MASFPRKFAESNSRWRKDIQQRVKTRKALKRERRKRARAETLKEKRQAQKEEAPEKVKIPPALRRHFKRHNDQAGQAAFLSLITALIFWPVIYFISIWATLMAGLLTAGMDAGLPRHFDQSFVFFALLGFPFILGLKKWVLTCMPLTMSRSFFLRACLDLLAFPYELVLNVFGNLDAMVFLNRRELREATRILQIIDDAGHIEPRRIEREIPKVHRRKRVMDALSLASLVTLARLGRGPLVFLLKDASVKRLIYPPVRLSPRARKG